ILYLLLVSLFERFLLFFLDSIWVCWLMWIHQLFLPFVGEANEHVLARALQTLSVIRDKVHEALNVDVIFKVDGQDVSHFRSSWRSSVSPSGNSALQRLRESKPLKRVHSTIELPVTRTHCESSME